MLLETACFGQQITGRPANTQRKRCDAAEGAGRWAEHALTRGDLAAKEVFSFECVFEKRKLDSPCFSCSLACAQPYALC